MKILFIMQILASVDNDNNDNYKKTATEYSHRVPIMLRDHRK